MKRFRTRVSREGLVPDRTAFNRTRPDVIDTDAYYQDIESSKLDRLDIEQTTDRIVDESSALRARITAMGPCACVAYLHLYIAEGQPETLAAFNARLLTIDTQLTIAYPTPIGAPYTAIADNQRDSDDNVFRTESRQSSNVLVRATDLAGVPIDLSVGEHEFVLICRKLLPETF